MSYGLRIFLRIKGTMPPAKVCPIRQFQTGKCLSSLRTRHISIRFYFVQDRINHGEIAVSFVGTNYMIADILTKPLQGTKFEELASKLMGNCNSR